MTVALETFLCELCQKRVIWMSNATGYAGWADEVQWREHVEAATRQLDESRAQLAAQDQPARRGGEAPPPGRRL